MKLLEAIFETKFDLIIDEGLGFDENKKTTTNRFINFCTQEMDLGNKFTCKLVEDRQKNNVKTTALYDHKENLLVVYGKNRMLGDILRSIAHELTHRKPFLSVQIDVNTLIHHIGGHIENEANAKAGELIKKFIYENEYGEYLFV